ncbi:hypothetical protein FMN50_01945 [Rhodobacterales bacterium]|nr:hypothetical protein FMN50_01945 [Rhodobacterales bacterium]
MALHRDLQNVVDWAWRARRSIINASRDRESGKYKIYGHLCGVVSRNGGCSDAELAHFARQLRTLLLQKSFVSSKWTGKATFKLQTGVFRELGNLDAIPTTEWKGAFIHVYRNKRMSCRERVYLNLSETFRATAFAWIVRRIWDVDGLKSAKVAAPGNSLRRDSALVYCRDANTRNEVIEIVKRYQEQNPQFFKPELPRLVASVAIGIGYGAEPVLAGVQRLEDGGVKIEKKGQSFSLLRAELIYCALEESISPMRSPKVPNAMRTGFRSSDMTMERRRLAQDPVQGLQAQAVRQYHEFSAELEKFSFELNVQKYFRRFGLDPEHPELQADINIRDI